jgi:hypothetical protein
MPTVPYLAEVGDTENAIEIVTSAMLRLYALGAMEAYVLQGSEDPLQLGMAGKLPLISIGTLNREFSWQASSGRYLALDKVY